MIDHVLDALAPQVEQIIINANRNLDEYGAFGLPVITDASRDFLGPLAGIASGLAAARTEWVAIAPCDSPPVWPLTAWAVWHRLARMMSASILPWRMTVSVFSQCSL